MVSISRETNYLTLTLALTLTLVKFFPIFFLNRSDGLGLSPTMVNLIFVLNPLLIAIGTQVRL